MKIKSLYIASLESHSGVLIVTMGVMELLRSRLKNIALFRPIIKGSAKDDHDINFLLERFELDQRSEECVGFELNEAKELISSGKESELLSAIFAKFNALSSKYDFVLLQGLAEDNFSQGTAQSINHLIAKNLRSPFISVLNGKNKSVAEIQNELKLEKNKKDGVEHIARFVNRLDLVTLEALKKMSQKPSSTYFLPELDELNYLRVDEIARSLVTKVIYGKSLSRVVHRSKITAMTTPNLLDRLEQNDLIIVSGDRLDVVLSVLLANYSKEYPTIAGIILTGGLTPPPNFMRLLDGLSQLDMPILTTSLDTYDTIKFIDALLPSFKSDQGRKIALAQGSFMSSIEGSCLLDALDAHQSKTLTPLMFEYSLFERAKKVRRKVVLPESEDERILRSADILLRRDVVDLLLLGSADEVLFRATSLGLDLSKAEFIDHRSSPLLEEFARKFADLRSHKNLSYEKAKDAMTHANYFATMLVQCGYADAMVSGAAHTTQDTILPALQIIKTAPDIELVSSLFFMCLSDRVLIYADCAINQNPTPLELAHIAISSAESAASFGIEPKVAMLSYSTGSSGSGGDVDRVKEATRLAKELRGDLLIEGPLQYDAAIDPLVAKLKLPNSAVAGKASVFIFPDLNTGNNTYKAVQRSTGALAIGPILQGLAKPINDLSRGCDVRDIVNTVLISAIQAGASS